MDRCPIKLDQIQLYWKLEKDKGIDLILNVYIGIMLVHTFRAYAVTELGI
jgi:hypothetical protein